VKVERIIKYFSDEFTKQNFLRTRFFIVYETIYFLIVRVGYLFYTVRVIDLTENFRAIRARPTRFERKFNFFTTED